MTLPGSPRVLVINGPNLGMLGRRDPDLYGTLTHAELASRIASWGAAAGLEASTVQLDSEGAIVSEINGACDGTAALIVNPGGYSHSSLSIMDALADFPGPVIEVHLSQVMAREPERRVLVTARAADVLIAGAGPAGYRLALQLVSEMVRGT